MERENCSAQAMGGVSGPAGWAGLTSYTERASRQTPASNDRPPGRGLALGLGGLEGATPSSAPAVGRDRVVDLRVEPKRAPPKTEAETGNGPITAALRRDASPFEGLERFWLDSAPRCRRANKHWRRMDGPAADRCSLILLRGCARRASGRGLVVDLRCLCLATPWPARFARCHG